MSRGPSPAILGSCVQRVNGKSTNSLALPWQESCPTARHRFVPRAVSNRTDALQNQLYVRVRGTLLWLKSVIIAKTSKIPSPLKMASLLGTSWTRLQDWKSTFTCTTIAPSPGRMTSAFRYRHMPRPSDSEPPVSIKIVACVRKGTVSDFDNPYPMPVPRAE